MGRENNGTKNKSITGRKPLTERGRRWEVRLALLSSECEIVFAAKKQE